MPQLSLYIDDSTLRQLKDSARLNKISVSQWVSEKLRSSFRARWPEGYFDLFGSIKDPSFQQHQEPSFDQDRHREAI